MDKSSLDEILAIFGNAEYSKQFWDHCNNQAKEDRIKYETEERNARLEVIKNKDKVFGPLIGD